MKNLWLYYSRSEMTTLSYSSYSHRTIDFGSVVLQDTKKQTLVKAVKDFFGVDLNEEWKYERNTGNVSLVKHSGDPCYETVDRYVFMY